MLKGLALTMAGMAVGAVITYKMCNGSCCCENVDSAIDNASKKVKNMMQ